MKAERFVAWLFIIILTVVILVRVSFHSRFVEMSQTADREARLFPLIYLDRNRGFGKFECRRLKMDYCHCRQKDFILFAFIVAASQAQSFVVKCAAIKGIYPIVVVDKEGNENKK